MNLKKKKKALFSSALLSISYHYKKKFFLSKENLRTWYGIEIAFDLESKLFILSTY